jgi:hypothetical protein
MSATWDQAWDLAEHSEAVKEYDIETKTITWCCGATSTPETPMAAISEINAMSVS